MSLHTWLNSHAPSPVKRQADNSDFKLSFSSIITLQVTESLSIAMTFWEHSITAIWWKTKGGWLETEITQNELENTARYMFNLALEQNLQRPQLEYAMMIHSTVFTPLHSSSASWNVKDLVDHVTYRVIILRISNYPQHHHSPRNWIFEYLPWHFCTHSPQRLLWNWKHPFPYIQNQPRLNREWNNQSEKENSWVLFHWKSRNHSKPPRLGQYLSKHPVIM
jgi:hypothetical protein